MGVVIINGKIEDEAKALISVNNRAFRYADGFFETMKVVKSRVILRQEHFERMYASLETMKFDTNNFPDATQIDLHIRELLKINGHLESARIRITIFAGDSALHDLKPRQANFLIQSSSIPNAEYLFNEKGIQLGIYRGAVKPADLFSPIKSNNFLPYVMASVFASENNLDYALVLNAEGNVADATIANVFMVKDGIVKTPSLSDGPVNGVMRRHLLTSMRNEGMPVVESSIAVDELLQSSEVFLTNAIRGIMPVRTIGDSHFTSQLAPFLYKKFIASLVP